MWFATLGDPGPGPEACGDISSAPWLFLLVLPGRSSLDHSLGRLLHLLRLAVLVLLCVPLGGFLVATFPSPAGSRFSVCLEGMTGL